MYLLRLSESTVLVNTLIRTGAAKALHRKYLSSALKALESPVWNGFQSKIGYIGAINKLLYSPFLFFSFSFPLPNLTHSRLRNYVVFYFLTIDAPVLLCFESAPTITRDIIQHATLTVEKVYVKKYCPFGNGEKLCGNEVETGKSRVLIINIFLLLVG